MRTFGVVGEVFKYFPDELLEDDGFHNIMGQSGFGALFQGLQAQGNRACPMLVLGLLEWWWDTTNSFHFPWGEMTLTPLDFTMISGLAFTSTPCPMDLTISTLHPQLEEWLGPIAAQFPKGRGHSTVSPDLLGQGLLLEGTTTLQKCRILLMLMICNCIAVDKGAATRCQLRYLAALADMSQVHTYDWAGLAYGCLIRSMRQACRQLNGSVNVSIVGYWRVLEVCHAFYFVC